MEHIFALEKEIGKNRVAVVDTSMTVMNTVSWMRATTMVLSHDAYVLIPRADGAMVRSQHFSMARPLVIGLNRYVPRGRIKKVNMDTVVSKNMILIRDNWTCQYCHEYGDTIDHIIPKSRGGLNTWGNLCVACLSCNGRKGNHTPEEVGFSYPKIPTVFKPQRENRLQVALYQAMEEMIL